MEIRPEHEIFGREIDFKDIHGIKSVFQPGILDLPYFFNPITLNAAMLELCGTGNKEIAVYFNDIEDINITSNIKGGKKEWWRAFQNFVPFLTGFPAGCELEYWYGPDGKTYSSQDFKADKPPYQAFVKLFDNALQGYSCYSGDIDFSSWVYDRETGENTGSKRTLWTGDSKVFLDSATMLHNAFREMERRGYNIGVENMAGIRRREVRIIYPERGALVSSLDGQNSMALLIENDSLRKIVQPYRERRE